jgi:hypothetical protein
LHYLEKVNPSYFDLLEPLRQWKILNVKALKEESEYQSSDSGFYKIITKLEKNLLIDSFINTWSNEKYLYLLPNGMKALGANNKALNVNRDLRFHDSIVSRVARTFTKYPFIKQVCLDIHTRDRFPLLERVPDFLVQGETNKTFSMAIEIELTQKSQDRVKKIIHTYSDSKVVNHILYISDKKTILNTYRRYLSELGDDILKDRFLFMHAKNLAKGKEVLTQEPVFFKDKITNLHNIFDGYW